MPLRKTRIPWISRLLLGLTGGPWEALLKAFLAFSVVWTLFEPIQALAPDDVPSWVLSIPTLLTITIVSSAFAIARKRELVIQIPRSTTKVTVAVGDLFDFDGHLAVACNEFYDHRLGDFVAKNSLHGKVISQRFSGDGLAFRDAVLESIDEASGITRKRPSGGPEISFPIGTTGIVSNGNFRIFLPVLSHTDLHTKKASAEPIDLWLCMAGLWDKTRTAANGLPVAIPLIGAGLSGVNLPPSGILQLLLLSIVEATRHGKVTDDIYIVLTPELFRQINLSKIEPDWSRK